MDIVCFARSRLCESQGSVIMKSTEEVVLLSRFSLLVDDGGDMRLYQEWKYQFIHEKDV